MNAWRRRHCAGVLEAKIPKRHRWVAMSLHAVTRGQANAAHSGASILLDHENRLSTAIACYDCERPYEAAANSECAAPER